MADSPETPKELYAKCEANAQVADRKTYEQALSLLAGILTFPDQLSGQEAVHNSVPSAGGCAGENLQRISHEASRYRDLVQWLKKYPGREQRWLLLALWLKQEGISEPMEFLPAQIYQGLTAEKRAELRVSIKDVQHYCRVEAWRPYFERLLKDRREKGTRDAERDLERDGYTIEAIGAARNKRRAIPAVCDWLAGKLNVDVGALRNAHSRVSSKATSQIP